MIFNFHIAYDQLIFSTDQFDNFADVLEHTTFDSGNTYIEYGNDDVVRIAGLTELYDFSVAIY